MATEGTKPKRGQRIKTLTVTSKAASILRPLIIHTPTGKLRMWRIIHNTNDQIKMVPKISQTIRRDQEWSYWKTSAFYYASAKQGFCCLKSLTETGCGQSQVWHKTSRSQPGPPQWASSPCSGTEELSGCRTGKNFPGNINAQKGQYAF